LWLSFRGSKDLADWWHDAETFISKKTCTFQSGVGIGNGFAVHFVDVVSDMQAKHVLQAMTKQVCRRGRPYKKAFIVGHSLGGTAATLAHLLRNVSSTFPETPADDTHGVFSAARYLEEVWLAAGITDAAKCHTFALEPAPVFAVEGKDAIAEFQTNTSSAAHRVLVDGLHFFMYKRDPVPRLAGRQLPLQTTAMAHGPVATADWLKDMDTNKPLQPAPMRLPLHDTEALPISGPNIRDGLAASHHVESYHAWPMAIASVLNVPLCPKGHAKHLARSEEQQCLKPLSFLRRPPICQSCGANVQHGERYWSCFQCAYHKSRKRFFARTRRCVTCMACGRNGGDTQLGLLES
jgi:hypothetical protein